MEKSTVYRDTLFTSPVLAEVQSVLEIFSDKFKDQKEKTYATHPPVIVDGSVFLPGAH